MPLKPYRVHGENPDGSPQESTFLFGEKTVIAFTNEYSIVLNLESMEKILQVGESALNSKRVHLFSNVDVFIKDAHLYLGEIMVYPCYVPHILAYIREKMGVSKRVYETGASHGRIMVLFQDGTMVIDDNHTTTPVRVTLGTEDIQKIAGMGVLTGRDNMVELSKGEAWIVPMSGDLGITDSNGFALFIKGTEVKRFLADMREQYPWLNSYRYDQTVALHESPILNESSDSWQPTSIIQHHGPFLDEESPWSLNTLTEVGPDIANPKDRVGQTKIDLGQVPTVAMVECALSMTQGSLKYGYRNFRYADVKASVYIAAMKRHIAMYEAGEDMDPDTEDACSHLGSVMACAAILLDAESHDSLIDDREESDVEPDYIDDAKERVALLQEKYGTDMRLLEDRD